MPAITSSIPLVTAFARPERYIGSSLWWLILAAGVVALAWGWLALRGARTVLTRKPPHEEDEIPEDKNPDLL
ncbi:MAG: hypothetical protein ACYC5Y_02605 [Symbiobacteriia bacterium]